MNWDVPKGADDYIHRIGRTGRAEDKGDAYTFFQASGEWKEAENIKKTMQNAGQDVPQVLEDLAAGRTPTVGSGSSDGDKWWEKDDKKEDKWWEKDEKKDDSWEEKHDNFDRDDSHKRPAEGSDEEPDAKRAKGGDEDEVVENALLSGKGSELSVKQLKDWLTMNGFESHGLKKALVERAERMAQDMV